MATPESKVKASIVKILKKHDVYYFFPATGGDGPAYGRFGGDDGARGHDDAHVGRGHGKAAEPLL